MFWQSHRDKKFTVLVQNQAAGLYRLAYGRLGNRQDAEDVLQETFLKAYRSIGTFQDGSNAQAWISTILVNTIRDHIRRLRRQPAAVSLEEASDSDASLLEDAQTSGPEQTLIDSEIVPALQRALQSLPDAFLMPVLLRDLHDLSYARIAQVLDVPMGTVMSRLSRGRQMLRDRLKESELSVSKSEDEAKKSVLSKKVTP